MRKRNPRRATPEELRVCSVLKEKGTREELAHLAARGEWSNVPAYNASREQIADHLGKSVSPESDASFFDSRRFSEAIVLLKSRPVLLVKNGIFDEAPLAGLEQRLKKHRAALATPIRSVGRLELIDHDSMDWCGTGWRIEDDLIVTNRHVASLFAERQGSLFRFRLNQAGKQVRTRVDFREEYRQPESDEHVIARVLWIAPDVSEAPDMAILQVVKGDLLPPPLVLARQDAEPRQAVAVVGYPARDSRNDAGAMEDIFGNIYDVKRFAPGEVVGLPHDAWYLTHDCSTLGGNSGSAVLSIDGGEVVGLHFGGQFRKTNYAVKASVIRSLLARRAWVPVAGAELKRGVPRFQEKQRSVADLAERKGFDEAFLGPKAALPKPGKSHQVLPVGKGMRLDYLHFSVVMSARRRLPILTAVNIDGALKRSLKRKDSWGFDPRIEAAAQVGHKDFYGPASFDKGHMVRREDPGWGDSDAVARQAEDDTFVYTNAVPQVAQLNQRSWLSLEDYVLQNARGEGFRISVFTGPVFRDDDPLYQGVQVPLEFWKVVAMIDADSGELGVSAYLLGQEGMMPSEGFRYGAFKTYQVPLAKVEASADLRFSSALRKADVLAGTPLEEALESGRFIEIDGPDDLLLSRPGPAGKGR
ncbi:DNA/RNA non-specific endonuclease [Pseudomonas aeruginosa]|uniref:DNA/RNA non-specific endonuclease n=1 Tax=Pseudomonas aeruginosa TaxID=287 RepID=UPI000FFBDC7B|nr:DNA/RNA non-specific endonuclease [Pseudomonas aeruginosa]